MVIQPGTIGYRLAPDLCLFAVLCRFPLSASQWAALGVVGVLVDNSVLQLSLFCAMHSVSFLLLVVFKPFANW